MCGNAMDIINAGIINFLIGAPKGEDVDIIAKNSDKWYEKIDKFRLIQKNQYMP
jgi:hypothetical protein